MQAHGLKRKMKYKTEAIGEDIKIFLPCGNVTLISKQDEWIFEKFDSMGIAGSRSKYVFVERSIGTEYSYLRERLYLARLIVLGEKYKQAKRLFLVDHIDRDKLNNRRSNLRLATIFENMANVGPKKAGYKGVFEQKRNLAKKFSSYIDSKSLTGKKRKYLGHFASAEEAAKAYDKAAKEIFGEFAYQNFPNG